MTREQILNSNLPPEEKQRQLNMLSQLQKSTSGATLNSLLSVPVNQFSSPTHIRPVVTDSNPKPNVNTFPLRNLPASPNVDLRTAPRQPMNIAPPNTANTTNTTNVPKRGIFDRFANAFEQANPFFAMGAEFNKMGSPRAFGSQVQADPMGAFRRAKYGDQQKLTTDQLNARAMFPDSETPLADYLKYKQGLEPNIFGQELLANQYNKYQEQADTATNALFNLENMEALLDAGTQTGAWQDIKTEAKRIALSLGFPIDEKDIASAEAFIGFATQTILPLVKMLGVNPTDKDLEFVKRGIPTLEKTVMGNRLMLKAAVVAQNRVIQEQQIRSEILGQYGSNISAPQLNLMIQQRKQEDAKNNPESIWTAHIRLQDEYKKLLSNQNRRAEPV